MPPVRRQYRRGAPDPFARPAPRLARPDRVKTATVSIVTAIVVLALLAVVLIPVVKIIVTGYRWAVS